MDERLQVGGADDVDRTGEELGRERDAGKARVAAVGAAEDGNLLGVGIALRDGPVTGVDQVVVHGLAPLPVAGVEERLAVAGRAATPSR